ncbi:helix-turn-helix transcriptional regulator [Thiomicrorhabdus indica]|uniref:helix-turn-helix transcriptional regulator n=1 Tax=Thiomicrorhabdus indica TaxID=2267253 RepID=UPI00102DB34C|nr:AlpA family phage regulatory protein [Thiomicrorhabdus indica]
MNNQPIPISQANTPKPSTPQPTTGLDPILRKPQLLEVVPLSYSQIRRLVNLGQFPKPVRLGANSVGWRHSDVQTWLNSREEVEGWQG